MNIKHITVILWGAATLFAADAAAQQPVTATPATDLTRQDSAASGSVAMAGSPRIMSYQGLAEKSGVAIDNQSMVVEFRAYNAPTGGTLMGGTVSQTLAASEVSKGVFTAQMDVDILAIPDDAAETYLEVAMCSPAPCTAVPLAPRTRVTHAALAASARSLQGAAYATDLGALQVAGAGPDAGLLTALATVGPATQEMLFSAQDALISATRSDGPSPLLMQSKDMNASRTYMLLDHAAAEVSFAREVIEATAGPVTPPPKMTIDFSGAVSSMSAFSADAPAAFDFKYGSLAAMRVGEDPDPMAAGQAVMMVGPQGLVLADGPLPSESNVAALNNYVRLKYVPPSAAADAEGGAAAINPVMRFENVSSNVATTLMDIDLATSAATFYGTGGVSAGRVLIDSSIASNTAGPGAVVEFTTAAGVSNTAGPGANQLELKVDGDVVDRWTGLGNSAFGVASNRISGSPLNEVEPGYYGCAILGGGGPDSTAVASDGSVAGVVQNKNICQGHFCTIAGGLQAKASLMGFVGGGDSNWAVGSHAVCGGGAGNRANGGQAAVLGGGSNRADGRASVIGGGYLNLTAGNGFFATVPGGFGNIATANGGFAGGTRAVARSGDHGSFVWADAQGMPDDPFNPNYTCDGGLNHGQPCTNDAYCTPGFCNNSIKTNNLNSTDKNQFVVRAFGGFWLGRQIYSTHNTSREDARFAPDTYVQTTAGIDDGDLEPCLIGCPANDPDNACKKGCFSAAARLTIGGTWTNASDRNNKENVRLVEPREVLQKVTELPIARWNYKVERDSTQHIGPMAQDFHAAFGLGDSDKAIATIDADGVALAAIQGLHQIVREKECEIEVLRDEKGREIEELRSEMATLKELVKALASQKKEGAE